MESVLNKEVIGIACLFAGSDKPYTYKTIDHSIKPGDFVIVESNKPSDRVLNTVVGKEGRPLNILSILEVVDTHVKFEAGIKYKPIVQKIDFEHYLAMLGE